MKPSKVVVCERSEKVDDLTGMVSGKLTILSYYGYRQRKGCRAQYWKALCECGNISFPTSDSFLKGVSKSCGCLRSSKIDYLDAKGSSINKLLTPIEINASGHKFTNLIGKTFGYLYVSDIAYGKIVKQKQGKYKWDVLIVYYICKCHCGNMTTKSNRQLIRKQDKNSCGCKQSKIKNRPKRKGVTFTS